MNIEEIQPESKYEVRLVAYGRTPNEKVFVRIFGFVESDEIFLIITSPIPLSNSLRRSFDGYIRFMLAYTSREGSSARIVRDTNLRQVVMCVQRAIPNIHWTIHKKVWKDEVPSGT